MRVESHADAGSTFGSDKAGVVEYAAVELGLFLADLLKGNPRNVELLFIPQSQVGCNGDGDGDEGPPNPYGPVLYASPLWRQLCAAAHGVCPGTSRTLTPPLPLPPPPPLSVVISRRALSQYRGFVLDRLRCARAARL